MTLLGWILWIWVASNFFAAVIYIGGQMIGGYDKQARRSFSIRAVVCSFFCMAGLLLIDTLSVSAPFLL